MEKILLIGTGPMSTGYAEVLNSLGKEFIAIGRGRESAEKFRLKTGVSPFVGGLADYLNYNEVVPDTGAIVATGTESLMPMLLLLLEAGISKILIEKPAAISISELLENESRLLNFKSDIFIAYNRRFYTSVIEAQKLIELDGGLQSLHFEFTEWAHKIEPLEKAEGVKENWFFANSTHVVDLAFFLAGKPKEWAAFSKSGELKWHDKTNFSGAGVTENGVVFSYLSNWESAGRWSIELLTKERRIYLKPLEEVKNQEKGTIVISDYQIDNDLDIRFKPGLYNQVSAFLDNRTSRLLSLMEHIENSKFVYNKILNGK